MRRDLAYLTDIVLAIESIFQFVGDQGLVKVDGPVGAPPRGRPRRPRIPSEGIVTARARACGRPAMSEKIGIVSGRTGETSPSLVLFSSARAAVPISHGAVPSSQVPVPSSHGAVPTSQVPVPISHGAVPSSQAAVPISHRAVPVSHGAVPDFRSAWDETIRTRGGMESPRNVVTGDQNLEFLRLQPLNGQLPQHSVAETSSREEERLNGRSQPRNVGEGRVQGPSKSAPAEPSACRSPGCAPASTARRRHRQPKCPAQRAGRTQPRAEAEGRCPGSRITTSWRPERPREPKVDRSADSVRSWRPMKSN